MFIVPMRNTIHVHGLFARLPETTPTNIMLTQVLQVRRLANETRNLIDHILLFARSSISTSELLLDTREHLQRTRILDFLGFDVIGWRRDTRAVTTGLHGANRINRRSVRIAHDRLAALRWEAGFDGRCGVVQTPCEEGVVYELSLRVSNDLFNNSRNMNLQLPKPP
jgi:hypothetical protein